MLTRLDAVERRQITDQVRNEARFETIFKAMDGGDFPPQKIFYDGQLWDARAFVDRLVKSARKSLLLVDNWATVETLDMLAAKQKGVAVTVVTSEHRDRKGNPRPKILPADVAKFNAQYPTLSVRFRENFHDRFLVIDDRELYLIGASLKDLGKKCFAFTRLDPSEIPGIKEFLMSLRKAGLRLAVATGSLNRIVRKNLEMLDIEDLIEVAATSEDCEKGKPAPDVFLHAAEKLGVDPGDCLVIEDAGNGLLGARRAGMACAGFDGSELPSDMTLAPVVFSDYRKLGPEDLQECYNLQKK